MSRKQKQRKQKKSHKRRYRDSSSQSQSNSSSRSRNKKDKSSKKHNEKQRKTKKQSEYQSQRQLKLQNKEKNIKLQNKDGKKQNWSSSPQPKKQIQNAPQNVEKKQEPNWQPSGILLQYYNAREGIALKFHEPAQSHAPTCEWRIYPFKDKLPMSPIILKQSSYLIGKDERVCDILCENSSISRQHAVIQFRAQHHLQIDGSYKVEVKPYIMDLQSTNGTLVNGQKIQSSRYYELLNKDVLRFGLSQRDYIMFKVPESIEENEQE